MDSGAPVHDPGMIKVFDGSLVLPFHCQQPLPACAGSETSAAVRDLTVGAENGKPLSCDGKTECAIPICMECRGGAGGAVSLRQIISAHNSAGRYTISDYSPTMHCSALCYCYEENVLQTS